MNIELLDDRVLIEVVERKFSKGGIVLPNIKTEKGEIKMVEAVVVKTGPGKMNYNAGLRIPVTVREGDTIFTYQHLIGTMEVDDKSYGLLNEGSIIAFIPGDRK
jgi:co-chaperonin GroES (HSP10)